MRSPLFKGRHEGNPYCEQCGAYSQIGYITRVDGKKLRLCKTCADTILSAEAGKDEQEDSITVVSDLK